MLDREGGAVTATDNVITRVAEVPILGSPQAEAMKALGLPVDAVVGYAAGKAALEVPEGYAIIRVVVVAQRKTT